MGRHTGPVCKLCRREGQKLFLKGTKCYTEKCPVERRGYPPGQHGVAQSRRRKMSDYALQLREKQKVKRIYGVGEQYFRNMFKSASSQSGLTGENLLIGLESRLDNIIFRLGFAASRAQSRQLVRHRHVEVNGRPVDIPSYQVQPGDEVRIKEESRDMVPVQGALESKTRPDTVSWLALDEGTRTGRMLERPTRDGIPLPVQEQLIVELYSK
ncbi:MAG: 30S ribosomal protein S4 [Candidatus Longimicrobiales bacterium M2_2A_002]